MTGIEQAAKALGLTERQVYRRISGVRPVLTDHIRKGENNKLLLDGSAIEILRKVEDHRKAGLTVSQAMERIRDSISGKQPENSGKPAENAPEMPEAWRLLLAEKDKRIHALEEDRNEWRELALDYKRQLPAPKPRRSWLRRILRPSVVAQS